MYLLVKVELEKIMQQVEKSKKESVVVEEEEVSVKNGKGKEKQNKNEENIVIKAADQKNKKGGQG